MNDWNVYFASCAKDGGIYHYRMSPGGKLTFVEKTRCDRPMYMIREDDRLHVILREPFGDSMYSGLVTYRIAPDGRLGRASGLMSTMGRCGCHLCSFRGKLYSVNYLSGSIFCSDQTMRFHEGSGPDKKRQDASHPHFIAPSPDGRYLFVTDLGLDRVFVYDGDLSPVSTAWLPGGAGPRHLAYLDGRRVVCVNELNCSVTLFAYEKDKLTPLHTIPIAKPNSQEGCAAIRTREHYIYVSNRGDNTISVIEANGSSMRIHSSVPCGGGSPRDFIILGDILLCANQGTSTVTRFWTDNGQIQRIHQDEDPVIPEVLCVCGYECLR